MPSLRGLDYDQVLAKSGHTSVGVSLTSHETVGTVMFADRLSDSAGTLQLRNS